MRKHKYWLNFFFWVYIKCYEVLFLVISFVTSPVDYGNPSTNYNLAAGPSGISGSDKKPTTTKATARGVKNLYFPLVLMGRLH